MYGIVTLSLVPLRKESNHKSEMVSQLLFGERVAILFTHNEWLFVRNTADNYEGWMDKKMLHILTTEENEQIENSPSLRVAVPILTCENITKKEKFYLPGGSILPNYNDRKCTIGSETYQLASVENATFELITNDIAHTAMLYLHAPYLWGGKTIFGIDCSGFVQIVFAIHGVYLPRDAWQQVHLGEKVHSLQQAKAGDLAFFTNAQQQIVHVGILLNTYQIIHASGCVTIDTVDNKGIVSNRTGEYSHILSCIKKHIENP